MEIRLHLHKVNIDIPKNIGKVQQDKLGKFAAVTFKKYMDKYVPMQTGNLANMSCTVKPWCVVYHAVYAHYQYEGKNFDHSGNKHPQATYHWDKAADAAHHSDLVNAVQKYIDSGALNLGK